MNAILQSIFAYASQNRLEASGAVAGLACVGLLIRQSMWNWPLGIAYAAISVFLFWQQHIYGQLALNGYFLVMNLYGWYAWLQHQADGDGLLVVTRTAPRTMTQVLALSLIGVIVLAVGFDQFTASQYPYIDFPVTVLSVGAMWLQARKKLESWAFWFIVNLASVVLFVVSANYFYVLLYAIYVPMAVEGHLAWRRTMHGPLPVPGQLSPSK